jgi:hypothetical protein
MKVSAPSLRNQQNDLWGIIMDITTTKYPATVAELGDMAHERGMTFVELLEELGPLPWPDADVGQ